MHREVEIPCTLPEAWRHVIDPTWLGDDGVLDAVPGGEGWVLDGAETKYLLVEELEENQRIAYRWASFSDSPSRVEIELEPTTVGTRISITEAPLEAKALSSLRA
jgi:uncharacterized protein YndB with AHSA1/START domain